MDCCVSVFCRDQAMIWQAGKIRRQIPGLIIAPDKRRPPPSDRYKPQLFRLDEVPIFVAYRVRPGLPVSTMTAGDVFVVDTHTKQPEHALLDRCI